MDLELGLKIIKTRDDTAFLSEYRLAKDKGGPVFESRETNTMFILSAHLKGYKKNNINIKISEDGRKISISGEKPVQEILMRGWIMHKKEVDVKGFNKVFKIPDGVKLDRIKAKYDEEEWVLNIFMPKLVKGICGAKIEEVKEEQKPDHILSSVGETSQKGFKESEVEAEENGSFVKKEEGLFDKKHDDANREISKEKMQKEVGEPKLGIGDGNGEKVMKRSELDDNVGAGIYKKIGDTSQKEKEEAKLKIEDGKAKGKREEASKVAYGEMKTSEMEIRGFDEFEIRRRVGVNIPQSIRDTSHDFVEKKKEKEKMPCGAKGNITREVIKKEMEESKSRIEGRDGENVKEKKLEGHEVKKIEREECGKMLAEANFSIGEETLGESKQKPFGEPKPETKERLKESLEESSIDVKETMKTLELDQNVAVHIPSNIGEISQGKLKSKVQQEELNGSIEVKVAEGESEGKLVEASKESQKNIFGDSIQKGIKMPKIEPEDEDQDSVGGRDGKEGLDAILAIREEFTDQLPKASIEESEELSVSKMQEDEDVNEVIVKIKGKEIEHVVGKGEGEEHKRIHVEAKEDLTKEPIQETEYVKEAIVRRKGKEIEYFVDKGEVEEPKRMDMEAKQNLTKESIQETEDIKGAIVKRKGKEIDYFVDKGGGEEPKRMHMEGKENITEGTVQEEIQNATMDSDQQSVQEKIVQGRYDIPKSIAEELPKKVQEQDGSKGLKFSKREEQKEVIKEAKAETESLMEKVKAEEFKKRTKQTSRVIQKSTATENLQKKTEKSNIKKKARDAPYVPDNIVKGNVDTELFDGSKRPKFQEKGKSKEVKEEGIEIGESVKKENEDKYEKIQAEAKGGIRKGTKWKGSEGPKVLTEEKDQHFSQQMSKASKEAKDEFQMKTLDSLVDHKRKELKETKINEIKEVKEELVMRKSEEKKTEDVKDGVEIEVVKKVRGEADGVTKRKSEEKKTEDVKDGIEIEVMKKLRGEADAVTKRKSEETKVVESEIEEKIQDKETHESKNVCGNQDILKSKKAKEEEPKSPKQIATIENQATKPSSEPRLPSIQQSKVEEKDKSYQSEYEAFLESPKKDPVKGLKNLIGMKENQESKEIEPLKSEIPLGNYLKKGAQVIKKDEFHKGQKAREIFKDETEGLKDKMDDRDQQYVQRDIEKMKKDKCIVESMEKTLEKDHPMKLEGAERKAEHVEVVSSFPNITSMGVEKARLPKNDIEELEKKELSPLTAKVKGKDSLELEKPTMEGKVPRKKEYGAESRDREKHSYGKEDIEAPKATTSTQATAATHLKEKGNVELKDEIHKPQVNQLPPPSKDDSKKEGKESIHSIESTRAPEVAVADKVFEPSMLSCSSSTQHFEIEEKDETDASHEVGSQECKEEGKGKTYQEVEQRETLHPECPSNQEESNEIHEIEEEDIEQEDEAQEDSQVSEEQKESKEEDTGRKENNTKRSKKLFVSLLITGSALIVSGIFIFIRQRRARKRIAKLYSK